MANSLIYPMFVMVLLTFFVLGFLFKSRVSAVRAGKVDARYFKSFDGAPPPLNAVNASRHFSNLFEVPLLFYVGCLVAMVLQMHGPWLQFWAWLFVAARIVHAVIHLGKNRLRPRILAFAVSCIAVLGLWLNLMVIWFVSTTLSQLQ